VRRILRALVRQVAPAGAFVLIVACGSTPVSPSAAPRAPEGAPVDHCIERPSEGDATKERRAEVIAELDRVDRELDAIDGDLQAAAQTTGMSLTEARVAALARKAALDKYTIDIPPPAGWPRMLARDVQAIFVAQREKAELATELGPAHPSMKRAERRIAFLRDVAQRQLTAERAFVQAWSDALAALPDKAKPDAIYKARLQALRATLPRAPSSDAPAAVRLAVEDFQDATSTKQELELVVGPKHPDMITVTARLDEANSALAKALAEADAELAARIAAPPKAPDAAAIARRAELADQARELRREYERLRAQ
jgi:hypothetical protein